MNQADAEIIKALETHLSNEGECSECAYLENIGSCVGIMHKDLYNLINRQKAEIEALDFLIKERNKIAERQDKEIERLQAHNSSMQSTLAKMSMGVEQAKSEAIKEFAERLKETFPKDDFLRSTMRISKDIDNLVKEMVGEG